MARPNQETIDTFISITGVSEPIALQKLEEHGGSLNEAVNAYFSEGDRNLMTSSAAVPQGDFMDIDDQHEDEIHRPPSLLSFARNLDPFSLDPTRNIFDTHLGATNQTPFVTHPREVREIPIEVKDGSQSTPQAGHVPIVEDVTGTVHAQGPDIHGSVVILDDDDDDENTPPAQTHSSPDRIARPSAPNFENLPDSSNEIEEEMIRAAIEASKREAEENYSNHELGRQTDLSESGPNPRQTFLEDPELAHAVSLSLRTAEQEKVRRVQEGDVGAPTAGPSKAPGVEFEEYLLTEDDQDVELNVVHIGASLENVGRWKFVLHRRLALERELSNEALQCNEIMELIEHAGLLKSVSDMGDCCEKLVKEFIVNIPASCDNPLSHEYQKVFVRGKEVAFSPSIINKYLGRSEEPYAELEATDNDICKAITGGKVKAWPKKGKLPASKLTPVFTILNRIAAANWVPTTHNYDVATSLTKFIYPIGSKINYDFGTYIFEQTVRHVKTLAVKMPIVFPSLLCGIIVSQRPDILVREDIACKRDSAISFNAKQLDVTPDVATSDAPTGMTRRAMIALLKDTCKALEEKKLSLETAIAGLELEEEQAEAEENVHVDEEEAGDSEAENTDGSDAF